MPSKSEAQSAGSGGQGKSGGSGEEWSGGKSGAAGGAGLGGIASLVSEGRAQANSRAALPQKTAAQAAGARQSPALPQNMAALLNSAQFALDPEAYLERLPLESPLRAQANAYLATTPGYYTGQPMTPQQVYAPVTSPIGGMPQFTEPAPTGAQPTQQTLTQALTPQQVYGGLTSNIGFAGQAEPQLSYGPPSRPKVGPAGGQSAATAGVQAPPLLQFDPINDPGILTGQSPMPSVPPIARQPMAAQPLSYGPPSRPNIGFTGQPEQRPSYGPITRPNNSPAQQYVGSGMTPLSGEPYLNYGVNPLGLTQAGLNQMEAANLSTLGIPVGAEPTEAETERMMQTGYADPAFSIAPAAEPQLTNQSTLGQPPAPQPTMSPSEVAAPAPQGMPATSYPVPSSATVPGLGLMSGIQQGIGAIRELFGGGGQPLFGEGGLFPADTRTSEERIADFVSSQAEMSQGDDRVYPEPTTDDFGSSLPGFGPEPETPAPTTPGPTTPAPPYVYPTGGYPIYGYNSYNDLMAAMGMAGGGQVRAGMGNAFAPGSYYARYNPHTRGLGGLRRG